MEEKTGGQVAYETFRRGTLGVRKDGGRFPEWSAAPADTRAAWEDLADVVTREWLVAMLGYPDALVEHACDALRNAPGGRALSSLVAGLNKSRLWLLSKRGA